MQKWKKRERENKEEEKTLTTHIKQFNHGKTDAATKTLIATANKILPQNCVSLKRECFSFAISFSIQLLDLGCQLPTTFALGWEIIFFVDIVSWTVGCWMHDLKMNNMTNLFWVCRLSCASSCEYNHPTNGKNDKRCDCNRRNTIITMKRKMFHSLFCLSPFFFQLTFFLDSLCFRFYFVS